jgi:hypothetical protein
MPKSGQPHVAKKLYHASIASRNTDNTNPYASAEEQPFDTNMAMLSAIFSGKTG